MNKSSYLICFLIAFTLASCGGGGSDSTQSAPPAVTTSPVTISDGQLASAQADSSFTGNLFLSIEAMNADGIESVDLRFINNGPLMNICSGESCGGTLFSDNVSGINPGDFGATPGNVAVTLLVTDSQQQVEVVSMLEVSWQPPTITNVQAVRSVDGTNVNVSWTLNPQLLRYNIYIASQTGVNQQTFQTLPNGAALLAVSTGPQILANLDPNLNYFVLLAGIDGSGESTSLNEIALPANGQQSRQPIANNDTFIVLENQILTVDASQGVLVNDADPDGDLTTVVLTPVTDTTNGALALAADGSFTYQPNTGFNGADSFEYQIIDDNGQSQTATVNLDVRAIPADLVGDSTSILGEFLYLGLGEENAGNGVGTGLYRTGDCLQDNNTRCSSLGNYVETPNSGNSPNQTGSYAFIQSYNGVGDSPVVARSIAPGSNNVSFTSLGDSIFELLLFPQTGGIFRSQFPDADVFANSLFFGAFVTNNQVCTGLPALTACSIGDVGLVNGAQLTAPLDRVNFNQTGSTLVDSSNDSPQAVEDAFIVVTGSTLVVDAPGVLQNDSDPDISIIGNNLQVLSQFSPATGALTAIGFDEYRQHIYTINDQGPTIAVNDRLSAAIGTLPVPGELTSNIDIEVASEALELANTNIPQGSVIVINGQTGPAEVFAVNPDNGAVVAQLNTNVGNGDVVGGAYNPTTQTLFLLQETQANGDPLISEVDTNTGATLNQFSGVFAALDFDVGFGDIEVNNETGSLYIIGNAEINILELNSNGDLVRLIAIPIGVTNPSGIAVSEQGERLWLASNDGSVFELSFANQGVLPQLQAELIVTTENGTLVTGRDGSFIYTPNAGFVGDDIFTYEVVDRNGRNSLNNVRITVTN